MHNRNFFKQLFLYYITIAKISSFWRIGCIKSEFPIRNTHAWAAAHCRQQLKLAICCIQKWAAEEMSIKSNNLLPCKIWEFNCTISQQTYVIPNCCRIIQIHLSNSDQSTVCSKCPPPSATMLWVVHATSQWMCCRQFVQCYAKHFSGAVLVHCLEFASHAHTAALYSRACNWRGNIRTCEMNSGISWHYLMCTVCCSTVPLKVACSLIYTCMLGLPNECLWLLHQ